MGANGNPRAHGKNRVLPGQEAEGWTTVLRSGLWRLWWRLSAEGRRRYYDELMPLLHGTKLDVLGPRAHDCYYLAYLGTKPSGRGRGYARKLIEQMAARVRFVFVFVFSSSAGPWPLAFLL